MLRCKEAGNDEPRNNEVVKYFGIRYLKTRGLFSAGVVKLVDAPDSKSGGLRSVSVRLRPPAPHLNIKLIRAADLRGRFRLGAGERLEEFVAEFI